VLIIVLLITYIKCLKVNKGQCNKVMYNNEEFEIIYQKPGFSSCKGSMSFKRVNDNKMFCISNAPANSSNSKRLTCTAAASPPLSDCKCGKDNFPKDSMTRVVGGEVLIKHKYPWLVLLTTGLGNICAGSIISKRAILTAAHCVRDKKSGEDVETATVKFGKHSISNLSIIIHQEYSLDDPPINDIALLILDKPLDFGDSLKPICLPNQDEVTNSMLESNPLITGGWGVRANLMEWLNRNKNFTSKTLESDISKLKQISPEKLSENDVLQKDMDVIYKQIGIIFNGFQKYFPLEKLAFAVGNKTGN